MSATTLTEMLKSHPMFQELPIDHQIVYMKMATVFQDDPDAIYCDPSELEERFELGTHHLWDKLLNMEPTIAYINDRMRSRSRIAARKAFLNLEKEAATGDVPAIRHINELSGLLEKRESNKIVVLHYIERPETGVSGPTTKTITKEATPS